MLKFTQEIKDLWLNALKSGKYTQATGCLIREIEMPDHTRTEHCCIGVLGAVVEGLKNYGAEEECPYNFLQSTIGKDEMKDIYRANDRTYNYAKPNYSNVIPLIESLPVQS